MLAALLIGILLATGNPETASAQEQYPEWVNKLLPAEEPGLYVGGYIGLGMLDGLYLGVGAGFDQHEFKLCTGTWGTDQRTLSLYYSNHLFGTSRFTALKPWYAGIGYLNGFDNTSEKTDYYGVVKLYIGRDFNMLPWFTQQLEIGAGFMPFAPEQREMLDVSDISIFINYRIWIHSKT